ncbi:phospholipase A1-like [Atheta coriaria]|uniref:phospholipase A1-like n=1 Tax=Dalotia coriaria TaxID=877792 RepID=UPI0031F44791
MDHGGLAKKTTCVGHSLGAHICGMISNHLDIKQYRIVALDPARPLVAQYANDDTRLTHDDAYQVQVIHTNAGRLGEVNQRGTVDFCLNGGMIQPGCRGHNFRIARCSHNQAVCFFASTVSGKSTHMGRPCSAACPKNNSSWGIVPGKAIPMGVDTPISAKGSYCVDTGYHDECPFNNS